MPPIRSLSLAHRLVWNFSGNLNAPAVALGDVDNDGVSQCVSSYGLFPFLCD